MKVEVKNLPKAEVTMQIELSPEEFNKYIDKAVSNLSENMEIKGFRKGKAPKEAVKEKAGQEKILSEAANLAVQESYLKAIKEKDLEVISQPQVNVTKMAEGNPFAFTAKFSILPDVDLPDYKKKASSVKKKEVKIEEKEIENALKWLRKSRSKISAKLGPAQKGDLVEIEYSSPQLEKKEVDTFILGEGQFLPGFEKVLYGAKEGEEKKGIPISFPQDHFKKELAGKDIKVDLKVKSVKKVEIPELNDEFAKSLGQFNSLEELKNNIKEGLKAEKEQGEVQRRRGEILEKIGEKVKTEIPEFLIQKEQERMKENLKNQVTQQMGLPFEEYLKKMEKTEEDLKESFLPQAKKRIKEYLILRAIGKAEDIQVSKEEIEERANQILKQYQSVEQAQKKIDPERLKAYTKEVIYNEKIFKSLEG